VPGRVKRMPEESRPKACSFFLVRYVPDLVRDECVNIGLFLYSPEERYLGCLFTDDLRRIKRFHPQADLEFLRELQEDFAQQIDEHESDLEGYLREMQESFSNLIQVTPPRTCFLADPQAALPRMFERYVGQRVGGPLPEDSRLYIKQRLKTAFVRAGVWDLKRFEKRIPASRWNPGDPFLFDYGYKPDGVVKFIHALSLKRASDKDAKALVYTMDRVRAKERAELTAVVEGLAAPGDEAALFSQRILEEGRIALQPLATVDDYARSVRRELMA
jgi:hypothetical protein